MHNNILHRHAEVNVQGKKVTGNANVSHNVILTNQCLCLPTDAVIPNDITLNFDRFLYTFRPINKILLSFLSNQIS